MVLLVVAIGRVGQGGFIMLFGFQFGGGGFCVGCDFWLSVSATIIIRARSAVPS